MLVQRKRSAAAEIYGEVFRLEDSACLDYIAAMEEKRSRNDHRCDANWNRPSSLVDDVSPDGASCCRRLLNTGGRDDLRLIQLLVMPHAVQQS